MNSRDHELYRQAATLLQKSDYTIALTGAGMSVDSKIPDFRSAGGLWTKYNPAEYATISAFRSDPVKVWKMLKEMFSLVTEANPNPGHTALAELEKMGLVKAVITQNIDNLHQEAGSKEVIEFHGNGSYLSCMMCNGKWSAQQAKQMAEKSKLWPPECPSCAQILKPDVVFFGETIPQGALLHSHAHAEKADLILVMGTSATVTPASSLPLIVKQSGGKIIEFNIEQTQLTDVADVVLLGSTSKTVPALVKVLQSL